MGNEFINLEFASTVVIDQLWHLVGQRGRYVLHHVRMVTAKNHTHTHTHLSTSFHATKCCSMPGAPSNKLKGLRGYFLACSSYSNDATLDEYCGVKISIR